MITLQLDPTTEQRLQQLAASQGQDAAALAKRVLEDFLEFQAWPADSEEQWAEASVALTPEILPSEPWPEETRSDGMPRDCVVNCDVLLTVPKSRLASRITKLSGAKMGEIHQAIRFALGLP